MGKIKDSIEQENSSTFSLKDEEFNYIMNLNMASNNVRQEYNRVMSAFLHYIACSRLGYESVDNLKFEIDFEDPSHQLKVEKIDDVNLFKETTERQ